MARVVVGVVVRIVPGVHAAATVARVAATATMAGVVIGVVVRIVAGVAATSAVA